MLSRAGTPKGDAGSRLGIGFLCRRFSCLPEWMKNKLSIASGGDTEVGKEIAHADANVFIVMVSSHRMGSWSGMLSQRNRN